jgi:hypothetical protein
VIVIAMALLIKSCDSSATTSALKNYNVSVYQLITASDSNAQKVLGPEELSSGNLTGIEQALATAEQKARANLATAEGLHAPSQMAAAQSSLVTVMTMRQQGILTIANNAQKAASKKTSKDAVYRISVGTSLLYGSDVVYKTLVGPNIAKALNAAGIPIGAGAGEQPINAGQVITDLGWLNQTWIDDKIDAQLSTTQANANNDQPGLHGHSLNSVTVDGTQIAGNGGTYTIPADKARIWVLNVTNGGDWNEYDVGCSVKIESLSDEGTQEIPETIAHQTSSCTVTLPSNPTTGPYSVVASVAKVPGEANLGNNTLTFTVTFT